MFNIKNRTHLWEMGFYLKEILSKSLELFMIKIKSWFSEIFWPKQELIFKRNSRAYILDQNTPFYESSQNTFSGSADYKRTDILKYHFLDEGNPKMDISDKPQNRFLGTITILSSYYSTFEAVKAPYFR